MSTTNPIRETKKKMSKKATFDVISLLTSPKTIPRCIIWKGAELYRPKEEDRDVDYKGLELYYFEQWSVVREAKRGAKTYIETRTTRDLKLANFYDIEESRLENEEDDSVSSESDSNTGSRHSSSSDEEGKKSSKKKERSWGKQGSMLTRLLGMSSIKALAKCVSKVDILVGHGELDSVELRDWLVENVKIGGCPIDGIVVGLDWDGNAVPAVLVYNKAGISSSLKEISIPDDTDSLYFKHYIPYDTNDNDKSPETQIQFCRRLDKIISLKDY